MGVPVQCVALTAQTLEQTQNQPGDPVVQTPENGFHPFYLHTVYIQPKIQLVCIPYPAVDPTTCGRRRKRLELPLPTIALLPSHESMNLRRRRLDTFSRGSPRTIEVQDRSESPPCDQGCGTEQGLYHTRTLLNRDRTK